MHDDGFDEFDWASWAEDDPEEAPGGNGRTPAGDARAGGRPAPGADRPAEDADEEGAATGWVDAGGVLHWEASEGEEDPRAEADSPLAADDLDMPAGAPDEPRVRAVHAWLVRRRAVEHEALGGLLLAQREQRQADEPPEGAAPARRRARRAAPETAPLELAIAEHQGAADEYEALLAALEEQAGHAGPGRALVELYLWLGEHLAELAGAPEAADADRPPATLGAAIWQGRAQAALATRMRVERMTAPDADE